MSPVASQRFWKHISLQQRWRSALHCQKQILHRGEGFRGQNRVFWMGLCKTQKKRRERLKVVSLSSKETRVRNETAYSQKKKRQMVEI